MLPNRERWLGAAVAARIFSRYGQSANPAAKPCYLRRRNPAYATDFAPRFVHLNGGRPRESEHPPEKI
jgi:hypothetical protein